MNEQMGCAEAHAIARELNIEPIEVGRNLDLMEIRVVRCQLGFFGYEEKERSIVEPAGEVSDELRAKINAAVKDGSISCLDVWNIADGMMISRMDGAAACEALKIKVCCCQLGAF
jgi:hypothetical protein